MVLDLSEQADGEECRANNDMEAVEAGCYKKGGTIDAVCDGEGGFIVLYGLQEGKVKAKENRQGKGLDGLFAFSFHDAVMGSCNGNPRGKQNGGV